ncbi:hypothetical protein WG66_002307 [Moniliophthora roreri]|nr:hypothetical protein WG66_002307 [Moniliophthora roreri]
MVSYTRILLIELVFVQASLAKDSGRYFACFCTDADSKVDNHGTEQGCLALRKQLRLRPASVRPAKGALGVVTWIPKDTYLGPDWNSWWTKYVCINNQKLSGGRCWWWGDS